MLYITQLSPLTQVEYIGSHQIQAINQQYDLRHGVDILYIMLYINIK